jgi:hypothetical protein
VSFMAAPAQGRARRRGGGPRPPADRRGGPRAGDRAGARRDRRQGRAVRLGAWPTSASPSVNASMTSAIRRLASGCRRARDERAIWAKSPGLASRAKRTGCGGAASISASASGSGGRRPSATRRPATGRGGRARRRSLRRRGGTPSRRHGGVPSGDLRMKKDPVPRLASVPSLAAKRALQRRHAVVDHVGEEGQARGEGVGGAGQARARQTGADAGRAHVVEGEAVFGQRRHEAPRGSRPPRPRGRSRYWLRPRAFRHRSAIDRDRHATAGAPAVDADVDPASAMLRGSRPCPSARPPARRGPCARPWRRPPA